MVFVLFCMCVYLSKFIQFVLHINVGVWDHPLGHEKPTSGHCITSYRSIISSTDTDYSELLSKGRGLAITCPISARVWAGT